MKERLVGAAVLIAIAVWLVPWVLDGPEAPLETTGSSLQLPAAEEPMPMRTQTLRLGDAPETHAEPARTAPPAPDTAAAAPPREQEDAPAGEAAAAGETPAVAVAVARTDATRTAPPAAQPSPAAATPAAATPPKPAPAVAGDWTVQLGSFGEEANARRAAQRAGTFGYKAETSSIRSGGRTLYRVRVGPQRTRAEADATASALRAHGIDASVVAAR